MLLDITLLIPQRYLVRTILGPRNKFRNATSPATRLISSNFLRKRPESSFFLNKERKREKKKQKNSRLTTLQRYAQNSSRQKRNQAQTTAYSETKITRAGKEIKFCIYRRRAPIFVLDSFLVVSPEYCAFKDSYYWRKAEKTGSPAMPLIRAR